MKPPPKPPKCCSWYDKPFVPSRMRWDTGPWDWDDFENLRDRYCKPENEGRD